MTEVRTGNWLPYEKQGNGDKYVMLPVPIKDANDLASPGGCPAEELHITIAYFGETTSKDNQQDLVSKLRSAAREFGKPHTKVTISGIARWALEDKDAIVLLVEGIELSELRYELLEEFGDDKSDHDFNPHITLGYVAKDEPHPKYSVQSRDIYLDTLVLGMNDEFFRVSLADGLALEEMKWVKPSTKPKPKVLSTYSARTTLRTRKNRRRKTSPKDRIRGLRSLKSLGNTHTKSIIRHIATVEGVRQYGGNIGDVIRLDENPVALRKPSSSGPAKKPKKLITKPGATIAEDTATPSMVSQLTISDGPKGKISDQIAPMEIFQQARETAIARAKASRTPNIEMISDNKARILEDPQLRSAGTDLRGNREQELRRSWSLFVTYGGLNNGDEKDGWIPCIYCAKKLSWYSKGADGSYAPYDKLEQDKVIPTKYGGKYVTHNLVPACRQCNASRGNKAFHEGQGLEGGKPDFWTDEWLASLDRIPPERSPQRGLYEGNERPMVPFPEAYLPKNRRKLQLQGAA